MSSEKKELKDYVLTIPDFPKKGIMFRDVTSVVQDPDGLKKAIDEMTALIADIDVDVIVGAESRGFIFGTALAYNRNAGFVMARKKGKLPRETVSEEFELEYGTDEIHIHKDAIKPGQKVVIVDDLIATGGTSAAMIKLVERLGGEVVRLVFLMELKGLNGRELLKGYDVASAIQYEGA